MKDRPEGITILSIFQLKKVRIILGVWIDLNEMIEDSINKAQEICGRRFYTVDNIMEALHFHTMQLLENACPLKLMIEQVERRCEEAKENIKELDHVNIGDMDQLIRTPFTMQGKIHILIRIWHNLAKN